MLCQQLGLTGHIYGSRGEPDRHKLAGAYECIIRRQRGTHRDLIDGSKDVRAVRLRGPVHSGGVVFDEDFEEAVDA